MGQKLWEFSELFGRNSNAKSQCYNQGNLFKGTDNNFSHLDTLVQGTDSKFLVLQMEPNPHHSKTQEDGLAKYIQFFALKWR